MGNDQKIPGASLSRRNMLRMMATATGAAVLAACGTSTGSPAAGDAAGAEPIELTYMTPDRELGQKVDQMAIASFNARMKKEGKGAEAKEKHFSYDLKHLTTEASYEAQIQAKNKFGSDPGMIKGNQVSLAGLVSFI